MTPGIQLSTSSQTKLRISICKQSYEDFVKEFWSEVPGAGKLRWNWHLSFICQELERAAERVFRWEAAPYDLVINISPGSSKTTLCSILFQPWVWTRMPGARFINATHTQDL